jgi:tRNA 2-thiouridine synthesizing protein A
MAEYSVAKVLDLKGLPCPMPIVKMSQEINTVNVGDIVEVHTTDPGSLSDFPAWAETTGNQVLETNQGDGSIKIFVKRLK